MKKLTIRLPKYEYGFLKKTAKADKQPIAKVIRDILEAHVKTRLRTKWITGAKFIK